MDRDVRDEAVRWLEWEDSSDPLEVSTIWEPGGLPAGIASVRVTRTDDLAIQVSATAPGPVTQSETQTRPGELVPEPPPMVGVTRQESVVTLEKVWIDKHERSSAGGTSIKGTAHAVRHVLQSTASPSWHAEWLVNFSPDGKVLPRTTDRQWVMRFARTREDRPPLQIDLSPITLGPSHDHIQLRLAGDDKQWTVRIGQARAGKRRERFRPGFMEFECSGAPPSEGMKASILDAASFAFGRLLLCRGGRLHFRRGRGGGAGPAPGVLARGRGGSRGGSA